MTHDAINPSHYGAGSGGVECIDAIEAAGHGLSFCLGNAMKYIWRAGKKDSALQDLQKARWYIDRAIRQLEQATAQAEGWKFNEQ